MTKTKHPAKPVRLDLAHVGIGRGKYKSRWYESPIDLPEARHGKFSVRHRVYDAGDKLAVTGWRQAMLCGVPLQEITLSRRLRVHCLHEGNQMWMSDLPEELDQLGALLHQVQPSGNVLIGGLGLGVWAKAVRRIPQVHDVCVVERSTSIIKMCADPSYTTIPSDLGKYLRTTRDLHDYYLLDTWGGTNEATWWDTVLPLRRIIRKRWGTAPEIYCWAENIMWGQLYRTLTNTSPHWYYTHLPVPMPPDEAAVFLNLAGSPWWERHYGKLVDRYIKEERPSRSAGPHPLR